MELALDINTVQLFVVFVVPGLVSMLVYRLVMPSRATEWSEALIGGLLFSSINLIVLWPLISIVLRISGGLGTGIAQWLLAIGVLLVAPAIWPALLAKAFRWKWVASRINVPFPTAWDWFFDARETCFVLVHLKDGGLLGGYWGTDSYASSFPNDGDIYLEAVYKVDEDGVFGAPTDHTKGALLRKSEYSYFELFEVPQNGVGADGD